MQKRAVRVITNSSYTSSSAPLFLKIRTLPLPDLIRLNVIVFMFKFHNDLLPSIFRNMFQSNDSTHGYPTRKCKDLRQPLAKSTKRTHSIRYVGASVWNTLSNDIKSSTTMSRVKYMYKTNVFKMLLQS